MPFSMHTIDSAPEASQRWLEDAKQKFGFVPNMLATMADEPAVLEAYMTLIGLFEKVTLSPRERQLVLLAVSQANECQYCLAAHSKLAQRSGISPEHISAARSGGTIGDERLDALLTYTREATITRGYPSEAATTRLEKAGFTSAQRLAVLLGIATKTLSNYINHVSQTPIDPQFVSA